MDVIQLDRAAATVRADLDSLQALLAAQKSPPSTVSSAAVSSALSAAAKARTETLALVKSTDDKSAGAVRNAQQMAGNAVKIASNAC